jgi:hypothetical protein
MKTRSRDQGRTADVGSVKRRSPGSGQCCGFRKETIAGARSKDEVEPMADIPASNLEREGLTIPDLRTGVLHQVRP